MSRETDLQQLAIGCLNILTGRAMVDFPGSTSAAPSHDVVVSLIKPPIQDADACLFPFQVRWHLWQKVVVPILQAGQYGPITQTTPSLRNALVVEALDFRNGWVAGAQDRGGVADVLDQIQIALWQKCQEQGYVPTWMALDGSTIPTGGVAPPPVPGEPVVLPVRGDPDFPVVDPELNWPEGHLKLTYPVVE